MKPHMHFTINSEARKIESKEEKLKEHKKFTTNKTIRKSTRRKNGT